MVTLQPQLLPLLLPTKLKKPKLQKKELKLWTNKIKFKIIINLRLPKRMQARYLLQRNLMLPRLKL
jgi:hypothetical protein